MSDTMSSTDGLGVNTYVSAPGGSSINGVANVSAAPGANGPASNMAVSTAILWVIGGAAAALVAIGIVFRRPVGQT
jgi:hypothetical protein